MKKIIAIYELFKKEDKKVKEMYPLIPFFFSINQYCHK